MFYFCYSQQIIIPMDEELEYVQFVNEIIHDFVTPETLGKLFQPENILMLLVKIFNCEFTFNSFTLRDQVMQLFSQIPDDECREYALE